MRPNPSGDSRAPGVGGLGGPGGLPELERMFGGGMQDSSLLNQVMQNPSMMQMAQSILSNPQHMNQVLASCTIQKGKKRKKKDTC